MRAMQRHELSSLLRTLIPVAGCHLKIKIRSERKNKHNHSTVYMRSGIIPNLFDFDEQIAGTSIINVASVPQRSPSRYPGGKTWLIPTVRKWLRQEEKQVFWR